MKDAEPGGGAQQTVVKKTAPDATDRPVDTTEKAPATVASATTARDPRRSWAARRASGPKWADDVEQF